MNFVPDDVLEWFFGPELAGSRVVSDEQILALEDEHLSPVSAEDPFRGLPSALPAGSVLPDTPYAADFRYLTES